VDNAACKQLYWAKLSLKGVNRTPYTLVLTITDDHGGSRPAEIAVDVTNAANEQVTPTIKGEKGQHLEACVNSRPARPVPVCITTDIP
jgi:hypothetical protein